MGSPVDLPLSISKKEEYRLRLHDYLQQTLDDSVVPELGVVKKGKVRDIYMSEKNVFMISSDRVSAFDYVLENLIPFKGQILNMISCWAFKQTEDIINNALVLNDNTKYMNNSINSNVIIQKKLQPIMVECIVRGYLWGSMAGLYEQGERIICGMKVPDGLLKFQKFDHPLFTPTTKAPEGAHDENITFEEMVKIVGKRDLAEKLKDISVKLYERGAKLAREKGLILIDTKYEFGLDPETGDVLVMDEVNTPDSSRICEVKEWEEKYNKIADLMKNGKYKNSSDVLANNPSLKIKEFSKQYVRDVLLEQGFLPDQNTPPKLTDEQVIICLQFYFLSFVCYIILSIYCILFSTSFPSPPYFNIN